MATPATVIEAYQAIRLRLSRLRPYLAPALFRLRGPVVVDTPAMRTMAIDKEWRIYVHNALVDRWDLDELTAAVAHEVWHLLLRHPARAEANAVSGALLRHIWNLAADMPINVMVRDEGLRLPQGLIFPETYGLDDGRTAEEYYRALLDQMKGSLESGKIKIETTSGAPVVGGSCSDGLGREWELPAGAPAGEAAADPGAPGEHEQAQIARNVAREIHERGIGHGELSRWASGALAPPRVPWQSVIAGAIRAALAEVAGAVNYSYRRPSRRQSASAVLMPSMRRPVPNVAAVIDTSESMGARDLGTGMSEIAGVLRASGARIHLIPCDYAAAQAQQIFRVDAAKLVGGGGTDMGAGLRAAAALRPRPDVTVVMTDGETGWPAERPACGRVIVCLVRKTSCPVPAWARVVEAF